VPDKPRRSFGHFSSGMVGAAVIYADNLPETPA